MEPNFDRAVIARSPDAVPRFADFLAEIAAAADLAAGDRVGIAEITGWSSIGDLHRMDVRFGDDDLDFGVLVRPRDDNADTFLRTPRWNISYTGADFDRRCEALLREVGKRFELVAAAAGLDAAGLHARYFRRPDAADYLEVMPGKKLYLRVTDHCDENCIFCNATEGNQNLVASKSELRDILDRLPAGELSQVIFSGGEPGLVKALPDYVRIACEAGARDVILQTNGVLLAADGALDAYLPWRDRLGIGFSLHAFDGHLSDRMTGALAVPRMPLLERFKQRIPEPPAPAPGAPDSGRLARKLKAIDRAAELGFRIKITCVVMRPNLAQVPAFARRCWDRWGARLDRLQFSYAMPRGNAILNPALAVRFAECVAPFAAAFELGRRTGLLVETSQSACVPPCVMADYLDHYDCYGDFSGGRTCDDEREKPPGICGGCNWDRLCVGVWSRYLETFGGDVLRAVTDRPDPGFAIDDYTEGTVLDLAGN